MPTKPVKSRAAIARIRAGFATPGAAAAAIGCSRPTIINWENGTDMRRSEFLRAAARAYSARLDPLDHARFGGLFCAPQYRKLNYLLSAY